MSLPYIREVYGVPAKRGARIRFDYPLGKDRPGPHEGTIVGARGPHLNVRLDGERHTCSLHPTWRVEYL